VSAITAKERLGPRPGRLEERAELLRIHRTRLARQAAPGPPEQLASQAVKRVHREKLIRHGRIQDAREQLQQVANAVPVKRPDAAALLAGRPPALEARCGVRELLGQEAPHAVPRDFDHA